MGLRIQSERSATGSNGLTSYNIELSEREVAADPNNPRMHPASPSLPADDNTSPRIPERRDPNAILRDEHMRASLVHSTLRPVGHVGFVC